MRRRHLESVSSRSLSVRGSWGTAPSVFWFLLYAQKERHGGEPYRLRLCKRLRDADRRLQIWSKISFTALFMGEKQALPAGGFYSAGKAARRQVRETSER